MAKSRRSISESSVEPAYYSGGIPVFEPTMSQFSDFYAYNKAINKFGMQSGIVKIVPPMEWLNELKKTYTHDNLSQITIKNPIVQSMNITAGYKGVYSSQNVERQRKYDIFQWKKLSEKPNHVPPVHRTTRRGSEKDEAAKESCKPESRNRDRRKELLNKILSQDFNIDVSKYTPERCKELETTYWKSLGYAEPMYGADMLGSLFKEDTSCWNVAELPNLLDLMDEKLPGVNDAYLYAGLWKATFSWHLEDQDLYSINYLHFGAPKQWYSIPQKDNDKFYDVMKEIFHEEYQNCSEFLRHKTFLASPEFLEKKGIQCNKIVHNQGEFIITYPYGYHSGFNFDFNLAESVNFALDDWFPFAEKTKRCECIKDSVSINHRQIYCKFRGIPYDPAAVEEKQSVKLIEQSPEPKEVLPKPAKKAKRGRKRQKLDGDFDCALCPNKLPTSATKLHKFSLLEVANADGNGNEKVHRICAESFPKHIQIKKLKNGKEVVSGVETIESGYRTLKCHLCASTEKGATAPSHGACFQCSEAKCTKSTHGTCAITGGFDMKNLLCKTHRSTGSKDVLRTDLTKLAVSSLIQFQFQQSKRNQGVFCGVVQRNSPDEQTLEVLVYPGMSDLMEVHFDDVIGFEASPVQKSFPKEKKAEHLKPSPQSSNVSPTESPTNAPVITPPIHNQQAHHPYTATHAIPPHMQQPVQPMYQPMPQPMFHPVPSQIYHQSMPHPYPPMPQMAPFVPHPMQGPNHPPPQQFMPPNMPPNMPMNPALSQPLQLPVFQSMQPRHMKQGSNQAFGNEFSGQPPIPGMNQFRFVPENR